MNPGFQTAFADCRTSDGRNVVLLCPLVFVTKAGKAITLVAGASSDGTSTPAFIWTLIPPFGKYWMPAILHDFLYRCTQLPKSECDSTFLEAMLAQGVGRFEAQVIYEGVHLGGSSSFAQDRAAQTPVHLARVRVTAP